MDGLVVVLVVLAVAWYGLVRPVVRAWQAEAARRDAVRRVEQDADLATRNIHRITQEAQAQILRLLVERRYRP